MRPTEWQNYFCAKCAVQHHAQFIAFRTGLLQDGGKTWEMNFIETLTRASESDRAQ